ncbi:ABC transporter permease [Mesobaculum littorinae]|uniref:ABC transporter permease n=1 Tax=Mesobaculum littorinae TaxID=2486419 RepID=A0A438AEE4_9RHOB|nr:ABC transporter permease [Mesobaculum littorinae]RVV97083.1 ABC transporter permease [Mesobaculum littorinae]
MTAIADGPPRAGAHRGRNISKLVIRLGAFVGFALIVIYFAFTARGFTTPYNLTNIVEQSTILGILAYGMTLVFAGTGTDVQRGGIDLSIAANAGLCAAVYAVLMRAGYGGYVAVPAALVTGMAVGALNGFAVVALRIMPLLATLAVMNIAEGLELTLTENTVVAVNSPLIDTLAFGRFLGISTLSWVFVIVSLALIWIAHYSRTGLRLYAVGGHAEAARAAGVRNGSYVYGAYIGAGLLAGLTSILIVARLSSSTPGTGQMLLPVLAAALLGTVFSRRLIPTIGGTLLAALFIGTLANGFQLLGISSYWVSGVQGALILVVVAATSFAKNS